MYVVHLIQNSSNLRVKYVQQSITVWNAAHVLLPLQVFDDVYTELTMAILQFLQGKPSEEKVFRCLKALERFCSLSRREVPQLVKMIGPEPSKFNGMSSRVEELVGKINAHISRV